MREIHIAGWDYVVPEGMSFLCVLSLLAVLAARGSSHTVWRLLVMPRAFSVLFTVYPRGSPGQPSSRAGTAKEEGALVQLCWSTRPGLPDFEVFSEPSQKSPRNFVLL